MSGAQREGRKAEDGVTSVTGHWRGARSEHPSAVLDNSTAQESPLETCAFSAAEEKLNRRGGGEELRPPPPASTQSYWSMREKPVA